MGLGDMISGAGSAISSGVSQLKDWLGGDGEAAGAEQDPWAGLGRDMIEKKDLPGLDTEDEELKARTVPAPREGHGVREERASDTNSSSASEPKKMVEVKDLDHINTDEGSQTKDAKRTKPESRPGHRTIPEGAVNEDFTPAWRRTTEKSSPPDANREKLSSRGRQFLGNKDAVYELISMGGDRYQFWYMRPTTKEVDSELADTQGDLSAISRTSYRQMFSVTYNKMLKARRDNAFSRASMALREYAKRLDDVKAESGISRRLTSSNPNDVPSIFDMPGNEDGFLKPVDPEALMQGGKLGNQFKRNGESIGKPRTSGTKFTIGDLEAHNDDMLSVADYVEQMMHVKRLRRENSKNVKRRAGDRVYEEKIDVGIIPGSILHDDKARRSYISATDPGSSVVNEIPHQIAMILGGFGSSGLQMYEHLHDLSMFDKSFVPSPRELRGYTFITRPHLNLTNGNMAHLSRFTHLLQADDTSTSMYIRQMLDTEYCEKFGGKGGARNCPLIDVQNPFNVLLCNSLISVNGFPDPDLAVESTAGGFFSEQQTNVIGYNRLAKGQDLQVEFKDCEGGLVLAMHDVWCQYMGYVADGQMCQYLSDIEDNLMGYTVSIYRFLTDHTGRFITRWAKATGCFPKLYPTGTPFNLNEAEKVVAATKRMTIPYWAHHFDYNNPEILIDFNTLVKRYCRSIDNPVLMKPVRYALTNNHIQGIPYVEQREGRFELVFKTSAENDSYMTANMNKKLIDSNFTYDAGYTSGTKLAQI